MQFLCWIWFIALTPHGEISDEMLHLRDLCSLAYTFWLTISMLVGNFESLLLLSTNIGEKVIVGTEE